MNIEWRMTKPDNYFEAILQLREVNQAVIEFVEDFCCKKNPRMISKINTVTNGYDYYLQSNTTLVQLGKQLKQKFTGEIITTATLHTKDSLKSKDLYRVTILFRQIPISKGETFILADEEYIVTGITKKIMAKNTKTGEKKNFTFTEIKKAKKINV